MIIVLITLAILAVLYFLGNKSVHHEITIDATPEKVWSVLTDTDSYDNWNPVMKLLKGEIKEGQRVVYRFTQDVENINEIPSNVKKVIPNRLLNQGGGLPFILTFDHKYILEPLGNRTNLVIHEDYQGIGVNLWNPALVEAAYARLNMAIKIQVESL